MSPSHVNPSISEVVADLYDGHLSFSLVRTQFSSSTPTILHYHFKPEYMAPHQLHCMGSGKKMYSGMAVDYPHDLYKHFPVCYLPFFFTVYSIIHCMLSFHFFHLRNLLTVLPHLPTNGHLLMSWKLHYLHLCPQLKCYSWCGHSVEWISLPLSSYKPYITHPESWRNSPTIHPRVLWQSLCCDNQCYLNMLHICPHHSCCSGSGWDHCCVSGWQY